MVQHGPGRALLGHALLALLVLAAHGGLLESGFYTVVHAAIALMGALPLAFAVLVAAGVQWALTHTAAAEHALASAAVMEGFAALALATAGARLTAPYWAAAARRHGFFRALPGVFALVLLVGALFREAP